MMALRLSFSLLLFVPRVHLACPPPSSSFNLFFSPFFFQILTDRIFTMMVIMSLLTTFASPPLVHFLYSRHYATPNKRTTTASIATVDGHVKFLFSRIFLVLGLASLYFWSLFVHLFRVPSRMIKRSLSLCTTLTQTNSNNNNNTPATSLTSS
jgi:uncharacterized RDD family membrane protein YckC